VDNALPGIHLDRYALFLGRSPSLTSAFALVIMLSPPSAWSVHADITAAPLEIGLEPARALAVARLTRPRFTFSQKTLRKDLKVMLADGQT